MRVGNQENRFVGSIRALTVGSMILAACLSTAVLAQDDPKRVMAGVRFNGNTSEVSVVVKGGPADRAGIKVGDQILSVDESYVVQPMDLVIHLNDKNAGDTVRLEVMREKNVLFFDLKLVNAISGDQVIGEDGQVEKVEAKLGVLGEMAPEMEVEQWHDLPEGMSAKLKDQRGKIVCLLMFQTDCEYSLRHGIPQVKAIVKEYQDDDEIVVIAVQTAFRNYDENTHGAAIQLFDGLDFHVPVGHEGSTMKRPPTYDKYFAPGTPWIIVIDQKGVVRYNDARLPIREARVLFAQLKTETSGD